MANLFVKALSVAGFRVEIASDFRSWEGRGDASAQDAIRCRGEAIAADLVQEYQSRAPADRPVGWFSYHLYHKAPDWIGPAVSRRLGIPYYCAEASVSPRQADGPWRSGHRAAIDAIRHARRVFNLNPRDVAGILNIMDDGSRLAPMIPFLDTEPPALTERHTQRQQLAARLRIDPDRYWLLSVAMMRDDAKLQSYDQLARTVSRMQRKDWILLIVGDGAAELQVRDLFRLDMDRQIFFLGRREQSFVHQLMSAADLLVWPAINEAIGMVALEALAMGLPAVCGRSGGIGQIVHHGHTGLLVDEPADPQSAERFVDAIESLLERPGRLSAMAAESIQRYRERHGIAAAARTLRDHLPIDG